MSSCIAKCLEQGSQYTINGILSYHTVWWNWLAVNPAPPDSTPGVHLSLQSHKFGTRR